MTLLNPVAVDLALVAVLALCAWRHVVLVRRHHAMARALTLYRLRMESLAAVEQVNHDLAAALHRTEQELEEHRKWTAVIMLLRTRPLPVH